MEKLPPELVLKIMLYLPPFDRLSCSLVCRRWAEMMTSSQLLDGLWLDIAGHEIEAATSLLDNSRRQYPNLVLDEVDLSNFDSELWRKIGENLRTLELEECASSTDVLYSVLLQCTELKSLKIVNARQTIRLDNLLRLEDARQEKLRDSLSNLRHLHLDIELTAELLDLLLGLMSSVASIFLSPRIFKEPGLSDRLPLILNKNRINRTGVDLSGSRIDSERLIKLVEETSGSLEELQVGLYGRGSASDAIVKCTGLRALQLTRYSFRHFEKLVLNSPQLEILMFENDQGFGADDMVHLLELKNLHTLSLNGHEAGIGHDFLCRLSEISTLVKLNLSHFNLNSTIIRSLGCLKNLRSLSLNVDVNSECFDAICENLSKLTELHLERGYFLRDADGVKLSRFKELRSLSIFDCYGLSDRTFERGVGSRTMKSLTLDRCELLTNAGLASIASHHDCLETLHIRRCDNIDDSGVVALLKNEPRLKELCVMWCSNVRREWAPTSRDLCPRLRRRWIGNLSDGSYNYPPFYIFR